VRLTVLILALLCVLGAGPAPAMAEKRVALVIGNNIYRNLSDQEQLKNAVSDAEAVKGALESLGFNVDLGENLDRAALIGKLSDFGARLEPGDIAFFFYAGHGVSFSGANYLLPSDIPAPQASGRGEEDRLADLAVAETRVVDRIRKAGARVAVVALDACRDNPLTDSSGRSIGAARGLAPPLLLADGVLSIYSAGIGQKAHDDVGDGGPNSVFTRILVEQLKTAGLGLREMAFKTQDEVAKLARASGYDQVPAVYSQISGDDLYLAGPPPSPIPVAPTPPVVNLEPADFAAALLSGSLAQLDSFLAKYPASPLADIVQRERERERLTRTPDRPPSIVIATPTVAALPRPPVTARAAMLVATAADRQNPTVSVGTVVWSAVPPLPGQPGSHGVKAYVDLPDLRMHASIILRKNPDAALPASHTIDLRLIFDEGSPVKGVKDIEVPKMRRDDSPDADPLLGVKVKINDSYFLIGLNGADADARHNLDDIATYRWFDFPLLLDDDRIAKLTFEKAADGERVINEALAAWK
jgi:hypothetical protein